MQSSNSCFDYNTNTPQCCFIPFFSRGQFIPLNQQGNTNRYTVPYQTYQPINFQKETKSIHHQQKANLMNIKRSISSLKQKTLIKNRSTLDTQQKVPVLEHNTQKHKNSLKNSHAIRRYYSPDVPHNHSFVSSQNQNRKNIDDQPYQRKQLHLPNVQQEKSHNYFKKYPTNYPLQFTKPSQNSYQYMKIEPEKSGNPKQYILSNLNKNQISLQTWQKINIQSTATHFPNSSRSKNSLKYQQAYKIISSRNPTSRMDNPQETQKQSQGTIIKINQNENKTLRKSSLQKILQEKKQEIQQMAEPLYIPVNPFKHIESFVEITKSKTIQGQQKPYESIKTKGRPVQSMLQLTKDLAKTKKMKKQNKRKRQPGLNEMQNVTVTSEYDDEQSRDRVQKIEESAVLLNFFNPPKDLKDRLDLSNHNRPMNGRSGFY